MKICVIYRGEAAFHSMSHFVWAKYPMQDRLSDIPKKVPITLIYGGQSWIRQIPDEVIQESRPTSYVDIQVNDKRVTKK